MANTKKATATTPKARKPQTPKTDDVAEVKGVEEETVLVKAEGKVEVVKPKRQSINIDIDMNALIPCKSVVYGELTYISKRTNIPYSWNDYGAIEMLRYEELITMRSASPKFLTKPWLIIQDQEVVESLRLEDIYAKLLELDDIDKFLSKPFNEIEDLFLSAPDGMKQTFISKITEMIHAKTLSDIRIVNMIDKNMGTGLKDFL